MTTATSATTWRASPDTYRADESFELPRLTRAFAVDELYAEILDTDGRSLLR
jgi:hypothetical protein